MGNEILREIWAAKEAFARRFNFDVRAMGRYLESLDQPGVRRVVEVPMTTQAVKTPPGPPESLLEPPPTFEDI